MRPSFVRQVYYLIIDFLFMFHPQEFCSCGVNVVLTSLVTENEGMIVFVMERI